MPSFQDSAVIFIIALLLFGPKELPKLARWVGKLMNEFRRASNEFRMQMEDEFRQAEQAEQQKKIAAIEAAAPVPPVLATTAEEPSTLAVPPAPEPAAEPAAPEPVAALTPEPLPIASNGDLHLMPPATGLPVGRSASPGSNGAGIGDIFDSIPHAPDPVEPPAHEASTHG
jgi:sec-independent protein translocase protein TatB